MGTARQLGAMIFAFFVLFAFIASLSRLLKLPRIGAYIKQTSDGIANLFTGTFGLK